MSQVFIYAMRHPNDHESIAIKTARLVHFAQTALMDNVAPLGDDGVDYGTPLAKRAAGRRLLRAIEYGEITKVVVDSLDCLFTSAATAAENLTAWDQADVMVLVRDVNGSPLAMNSPAGRTIVAGIEIAARLERGRRSAQAIARRSAAAEQRRFAGGQVRYGWAKRGDRIMRNPNEQRTIAFARKVYDRTGSMRAVARELNGEGWVTRSGSEWTHNAVRDQLLRENNEPWFT